MIEITFRHVGQPPRGRADLPKTNNGSNPPPPAAPEEDSFGLPVLVDDPEDGAAPKDDKMETASDMFESAVPADFPLAKAFSQLPHTGFEVRLRFRKPSPNWGTSWWYWAVACGLLAGLSEYKVPTKTAVTRARQKWDLGRWILEIGT